MSAEHGFGAHRHPTRYRNEWVDRDVVRKCAVVSHCCVDVQMNVPTKANVGGGSDAGADDRARTNAYIVAERGCRVDEDSGAVPGGGEAFINDSSGPAGAYADDEADFPPGGHDPVRAAENSGSAGLDTRNVDRLRFIVEVAQEVPRRRHRVDGIDDVMDLASEAATADDDQGGFHAVSRFLDVPRNSDIVASASAEMPSRRRTEVTVANRIFRSPTNVW